MMEESHSQPASVPVGEVRTEVERGAVRYGMTTIEYTVTRSRRRKKTVEITLDHSAGVLVAAPEGTSTDEIRQIVLRRAGWIVLRAAEQVLQPRRKQFVSGESLPYLGREARLTVEHKSSRRVTVMFEHWGFRIVVPTGLDGEARRAAIEAAFLDWYRAQALRRIAVRTEHWARVAGWRPTDMLIRDQRQRWGSCSPDGTLRFNWRIVMAPPSLIDYVVLHELVHLRIRKHTAAFWAEVGRLMPDYGIRRMQLREIGPRLSM
jgi:predicted metal-dependent hydrolase